DPEAWRRAHPGRGRPGPRRRHGVAPKHDLLAAAVGVHGGRRALLRERPELRWRSQLRKMHRLPDHRHRGHGRARAECAGHDQWAWEHRPQHDLRDPQERYVHGLRPDRRVLHPRRAPAERLTDDPNLRYTPRRSAMRARWVLLEPKSGSSDLARFT